MAGSYVLFSVEDNGAGMDEATLSHIFDPFYSTKVEGYGLGLAAVLGIVRGHHGGICVKSKVGKGTSFKLVFPQSPQISEPEFGVQKPQPESSNKGTVLVIDDEIYVREAVCDILAIENIHVLIAEDGQTGVDVFTQHQNEIVLILLDLSMPGLSGGETLTLLRQVSHDVTIILTSGYPEQDVKSEHQLADDYLQKPYNLQQLIKKVSDYL